MCRSLKMLCIVLSLIQLIGAYPLQENRKTQIFEVITTCMSAVEKIRKSSCAKSYVPVVSKSEKISEFSCKLAHSLKTLQNTSQDESEKKITLQNASLKPLKEECTMFLDDLDKLYNSLIHLSGPAKCEVDYANEEYLGMTLNSSLEFFRKQLF